LEISGKGVTAYQYRAGTDLPGGKVPGAGPAGSGGGTGS